MHENFERRKNVPERTGFYTVGRRLPYCKFIKGDIENQKGYVVKSDGKIAGYMCIDFDGEPAYKDIRDGVGIQMTVMPLYTEWL